jgi:hypothetical protein
MTTDRQEALGVEINDAEVALTMRPLHWLSFRAGDRFEVRPPRGGVAYATLRWDEVMDSFDLCAGGDEAVDQAEEAAEEET